MSQWNERLTGDHPERLAAKKSGLEREGRLIVGSEWVGRFFAIFCLIVSISSLFESLGEESEDGFLMRSCRVPC
jgi:hypothetical protein